MTKLSLHHDGENPNLSIHLREGQYCTVGSSAAADYSIRDSGIEPVHCRIGCQASGGYIECLNALDSISINDVTKGRSRLTNGDTLRIGTAMFRVEMPESKNERPNFSIEFAAEDTPTAKIGEEFESEGHSRPASPPESQSPESQSPESQSPESDDGTLSAGRQESPDARSAPTESRQPTVDNQPLTDPRSPEPSKPLFEFDSAEPADMEISHSEFEELSDPDSKHITLGAVDLERELVDSNPPGKGVAAILASGESAEPVDDERGTTFPGATFLGKYWKWNGEPAINALQQLIGRDRGAWIYRSDINQIYADSFQEISLRRLTQLQPAVFLISSLDLRELQKLVRRKRWEDRIGHPQAVTMFLTFMPKRILIEFFEAIEACVLIHENDVELVRIRKTY